MGGSSEDDEPTARSSALSSSMSWLEGTGGRRLSGTAVASALWTSNLVGVAFARSLHYQFLPWYWHSLPLVLSGLALPRPVQLLVVALVELAWNRHPPDASSSFLLTCVHITVVAMLVAGALYPAIWAKAVRWADKAVRAVFAVVAGSWGPLAVLVSPPSRSKLQD